MATQTLAEASKFFQDELVRGVAMDIVTVNPLFQVLPFTSMVGSAITVNREDALGDSGLYNVGDTITDRSPGTYAQTTFSPTKLIGQIDMDELTQLMGENAGSDTAGREISGKAKSIGRLFQSQMANGDGVKPNMNSFHSLVDSGQFTTASGGRDLSFEGIDELLDLVLSKDGVVDFLMSHRTLLRAYKVLYRAMGGSEPTTTVFTLPDGTERRVLTYEGIPWFANDYLSTTETANGAALTGGNLTSLWAGAWDDGTRRVGLSAIYPEGSDAGIQVVPLGISEERDEQMWRLKQYVEFANFNRKALARHASLNLTITA